MLLDEKLQIRIKDTDKEKLRKASKFLGITLSRFVVNCALEKAEEIIKNENKEIDK